MADDSDTRMRAFLEQQNSCELDEINSQRKRLGVRAFGSTDDEGYAEYAAERKRNWTAMATGHPSLADAELTKLAQATAAAIGSGRPSAVPPHNILAKAAEMMGAPGNEEFKDVSFTLTVDFSHLAATTSRSAQATTFTGVPKLRESSKKIPVFACTVPMSAGAMATLVPTKLRKVRTPTPCANVRYCCFVPFSQSKCAHAYTSGYAEFVWDGHFRSKRWQFCCDWC